ncbi:hypothetical protein [Streptomyces europaeiscabiei]|uniref:hypothetical protein n=1 Tax=Streptomyces europaeiscabiei TaxID=146819 RepID=UPI002E150200|nr:hypothetical protein OHB30_50340 [Streptomyces europaeiscabiei]
MSGGGLQRLADDLPDEVHELVEALRMLFSSLDLSLRRYALRCHCDASVVSRYLSGDRPPPWSFVEGLVTHVAEERGEPATQEALTHLRGLHRRAVLAAGSSKGKAQELQLLLEQADEEARQSKAREQMTADLLHERQVRIHQLQVQMRAVEAARAVDREEWDTALAEERRQQQVLQGECDRLYAEVRTLRAQLTKAQAATALAEEHCAQLERQLDAAEQEEQPEADRQHQAPRHPAETVENRTDEHDPDAQASAEVGQESGESHVRAAEDRYGGARGPFLREYALTGAFRRPSAQVASVLHYHNGGHSIVWPHQESRRHKPLLGRPYAVTEVLLGMHLSSFSMMLPAASGGDFFGVDVDVRWEVVDPYAVVLARLVDVAQVLTPEVQDRLRAVSLRFPLDQANDAWQAMRSAVQEELAWHLGLRTRTFVRVGMDQPQIRRQALHYRALLDNGDTEALAYLMARNPSDTLSLLTLIQEGQRAANKERTDLLRLFIERGLLSGEDINEQARSVLSFLADNEYRIDDTSPHPALPAQVSAPPVLLEPQQEADIIEPAEPDGTPPAEARRPAPDTAEADTPTPAGTASRPTYHLLSQAEEKVRSRCEETQRIHGPDHRLALAARHDWAGRVGMAGDPDRAADLYRALAADYTRIHGRPSHRGVLAARREQARWAREAGRTAEAKQLYAQLARHYRTLLGPGHRLTRAAEAARKAGPSTQ